MWYSSPLNLSMSWVNDFHDVDSYLSSLNLGMAELLKTLFQSYSHSVLLSHLYKKVLLFHHSHFLNLPFTLSILLSSCSHSPTCSQSPSQSHCTLIARFLKAGKYAKRLTLSSLSLSQSPSHSLNLAIISLSFSHMLSISLSVTLHIDC